MIACFFLYPEKNRSRIFSKLIASCCSTLLPPSLYSSHFSKKWDFLLCKLCRELGPEHTVNPLTCLANRLTNSNASLYLLMCHL